jgi:glycosyltransferase involved in cell wall biosynthesis
MWPRVTIVTPSYNQAPFLEATIRSVLLQNYPNLEYIVIDGGSTDGSVAIIEKYAPWLSFWVSERDEGQADAINKGFARSTGEILGWLNSDDLLRPNALSRVARVFMSHPSVNVVCGFRKVVNTRGQFRWNRVHDTPHDEAMRHICFVSQETVFWRRKVYETIGPLDAAFRYTLDYEYWQRMIAAGYHFTLLPYFLGVFRRHPRSKGATLADVRARELRTVYWRYLGRDVTEFQMYRELGVRWFLKWRILIALSITGLFDLPPIAGKLTGSSAILRQAPKPYGSEQTPKSVS